MKTTMKTLVLAMALTFILPSRSTAQGMPVYDNTNFISLAKSLVESAKQTSQLLKTVEFLKTQKDNIEKVNNVIRQLNAIKEMASNNQILFNVVRDDLREILNSPYIKPDEVTRISDSFNDIIESSLDSMNFIEQILSSNFLKMTDAERAGILKQKEMESNEMVAEITKKTERYRDIISFRKMQDKVNNRATNY
ncbi:conjugal transfer protein [Algibacter lectus]|uniref:conjugal transfer protein n=1 Tax=Algibacter lectus TaxID=221126 RepID=UPI0026E955B2|nr:conjugal transfer protein [Algibacter lectus]MDO7136041.1 conjugal transfer protein [Algibacter lectus]